MSNRLDATFDRPPFVTIFSGMLPAKEEMMAILQQQQQYISELSEEEEQCSTEVLFRLLQLSMIKRT